MSASDCTCSSKLFGIKQLASLPLLRGLIVISLFAGSIHWTYGQEADQAKGEKTNNRWPSIKQLVESKDLAAAAKLAVEELEGDYPDRQYAMWKWWETTFGDREDYMELSRRFGQSLFDVYDHASASRRRIITEMFGRREFDVSKPGSDLRAEIEKKRKPATN